MAQVLAGAAIALRTFRVPAGRGREGPQRALAWRADRAL